MATKRLKPSPFGPPKEDVDKLTVKQRMFVYHLLESPNFSVVQAAKLAGYGNPAKMGYRLMKKKSIQLLMGKAQRDREKRCELTGDDVLNYLKQALYFNPLHYFKPGEDGTWEITDINSIPEEIGRLINKMKIRTATKPDGTVVSYFEVEMVDKTAALGLAMKHVNTNQSEVTVNIDFDKLYMAPKPEEIDANRIESMILDVSKPQIEDQRKQISPPKPECDIDGENSLGNET